MLGCDFWFWILYILGDGFVEGYGEKLCFCYFDREYRKKYILCVVYLVYFFIMELYVELIKYRISDDVRNWVNLIICEKWGWDLFINLWGGIVGVCYLRVLEKYFLVKGLWFSEWICIGRFIFVRNCVNILMM